MELDWTGPNPVHRGGDEYDWHTIIIGWGITGRVIIATARCNLRGRCKDAAPLAPDWPLGRNRCRYCRTGFTDESGWTFRDDLTLCPKCTDICKAVVTHPEGPLEYLREFIEERHNQDGK